jgi:hypothetical protein
MNRIVIHTPAKNIDLVKNVCWELGIDEFECYCAEDHTYQGFHLDNRVECVILETSSILHIDLISRLKCFGPVELEPLSIDITLN